ncbi:MAG: rhomboid family intramembrane serine protease [Bacteroidia bacterium]
MTTILIIVTVIISFMAFSNRALTSKLIFNPYMIQEHRQWYRFITSGFIHADPVHLFVNMFVLYSFGGVVEQYFNIYFGDNLLLSVPFVLRRNGSICTSDIQEKQIQSCL